MKRNLIGRLRQWAVRGPVIVLAGFGALSVVTVERKAQRITSKQEDNQERSALVVAVNKDWNFLVISAGEKSVITTGSTFQIQRDGRLIGRVAISALERDHAVAEIVPGPMEPGENVQAGDRMMPWIQNRSLLLPR